MEQKVAEPGLELLTLAAPEAAGHIDRSLAHQQLLKEIAGNICAKTNGAHFLISFPSTVGTDNIAFKQIEGMDDYLDTVIDMIRTVGSIEQEHGEQSKKDLVFLIAAEMSPLIKNGFGLPASFTIRSMGAGSLSSAPVDMVHLLELMRDNSMIGMAEACQDVFAAYPRNDTELPKTRFIDSLSKVIAAKPELHVIEQAYAA